MACSRCKKKLQRTLPPGVRVVSLKDTVVPDEVYYTVQFLDAATGTRTYRGPSGKRYRFDSGSHKIKFSVPECDAAFFARFRAFRVEPVETILA